MHAVARRDALPPGTEAVVGGPMKFRCFTSGLRCTVCGEMAWAVRWCCCGYVLDLLCGKCWSWASRMGLR